MIQAAQPHVRSVALEYEAANPLAVFAALRRMVRPTMMLQSAPGAGALAHHTVIAAGRAAELVGVGPNISLTARGVEQAFSAGHVLQACRELLERCRPELDCEYAGFLGAYGVVSFEFAEYFEKIEAPVRKPEGVPDIHLIVPEIVVVFDHVNGRAQLLSLRPQFDDLDAKLQKELIAYDLPPAVQTPVPPLSAMRSPLSFRAMVDRAKASIYAGDAYQVVLSQGWTTAAKSEPLEVYRRLAAINPSPYMYLIELPEATLLGASPEMVCTLHEGRARVRPLAGTVVRPSRDEDEVLAEQNLRRDSKERAEHVMLVDLARNDLGRVCEIGSIRVVEMLGIERYSHVMHLVSDVQGVLCAQHDGFDLFAATFPAGTVSGAPKIRAMQLIGQLEGHRRGYYGGAVLRAGFDGSFDSCIVLRSATMHSGRVEVRAGAGIVADSIPEREEHECRLKAQAVAAALGSPDFEP